MFKFNKKNKDTKEKSKKRKFLIFGGIALFMGLFGTLAYFTTSTDLVELFNTALYGHNVVETFESPSDWTPGTTTSDEIVVTNTGSIAMALRASYVEKWVNGNGTEISLTDSDNNVASIIAFNDSWTKDADGYYYYGSKTNMTRLEPEQTSTSFISSVTFNKDIKTTLNKEVSNDGKTITYTSSGNGYDKAKYYLTIIIDTIQYDQAQNVWGE